MNLFGLFRNLLKKGTDFKVLLTDGSTLAINASVYSDEEFEKMTIVDGYIIFTNEDADEDVFINLSQIVKIFVPRQK